MGVTIRKNQKYTYRDYLTWNADERWELIDGVPYAMAPGPSLDHQRLVKNLAFQLEAFLQGQPCEVVISPIDVRFEEDDQAETVVQPDVLVVCDPSKLSKNGVVGAPDLIVEILSPSAPGRDTIEKMRLYEREGVSEYWIVSPDERAIYKNMLVSGRYTGEKATEGQIASARLSGFALDVDAFFASLEGLPR